MKKISAAVLALIMCLSFMPAFAAEEDTGVTVYADWQFNEDSVLSGSIAGGDLMIKDQSGNGNTLKLNTYGSFTAENLSFSDEGALPGKGSIFFNSVNSNDSSARAQVGSDFTTVDTAPINKNSFEKGYTIEILYKMPDDWNNTDRWTNLIARLGYSNKIDSEFHDECSSHISVSNCKEIQFIPANAANSKSPGSVWSVAMDKAENWYSIVITSDGNSIRSYVNGAAAFRDYTGGDMNGLYADPSDGRFRIGARIKNNGTPYRFTRGYIQEIRISEGVLEREKWLMPDPEQYMGEYGNNEDFLETPQDRYNFVFLPDVQNTVQFMPDVLYKAMDWMVENQDYANISAVLGLGDNVNNFWEWDTEWANVTKAMKILTDGGVKLLMMPGNHDSDHEKENYYYYNRAFGLGSDYLKAADYVTNDSPSGISSYMKVKAGSYTYLLLAVGMYTYSRDETWIRRVLAENANLPAIVISHDLQNCSETVPNDIKLSSKGSSIWNIVKQYDNVFLMVGGHSHGYGTEKLINDAGHPVYSVLADYQFSFNGGNALFKFAEFDEKNNRIHVSTFSPYVQSLPAENKSFFDVNYMTGKGNDDMLEINFAERFAFAYAEPTYGENLIENFSFEENADGWTYNNNGTTGPVQGWVRSNEQARGGSWSLKQNADAGSASDQNLGTYLPIEGGKKYRLTYWEYSSINRAAGNHRMHAAVAVSDTGGFAGIDLQLIDCGGFSSWVNDDINKKAPGSVNRDPAYTAGWSQRTYVFDTTNHPEAKYILLAYAWGGTDNQFYLDDFSLTEITETYPVSFGTASAERTEKGVSVWSVIKNASKAETLYYIAAGYDSDGRLVSVASKTELNNTELELPGQNIEKVKLFCWKTPNSMQELCSSLELTVTD